MESLEGYDNYFVELEKFVLFIKKNYELIIVSSSSSSSSSSYQTENLFYCIMHTGYKRF